MLYDVREVANYVLDIADGEGRGVSNIVINKIVYFCHEQYLLTTGSGLVDAKIEAWEYGPVFRELYHQFKKFGKDRITERAQRFDFTTKRLSVASHRILPHDQQAIEPWVKRLLCLSPAQLVDLAHVPGGPWYSVFHHETRINCGMEITDSIILRWGKRTLST